MVRTPANRAEAAAAVSTLPPDGRVVAVIVGVETYQSRSVGGLSRVHYARGDAEGFAEALRAIYPEDRLRPPSVPTMVRHPVLCSSRHQLASAAGAARA